MAKSRRANAVMFGFDFQVNAAIVLMIENIEDLKSLRLEGNYEDIELELDNNKYILAQAKAVEKSSTDFKNVRKNLKKSLISLSDGSKISDCQQLILITNSPNPLNEDVSRNLFWGIAHRSFDTLPESSKKIIQGYVEEISQPLDLDKFVIKVFPFETDNDAERYKAVRQVVGDFIGDLNINVPGIEKRLLEIWQNEVFSNGTKKNSDIKLKKKDIIWPILLIATDIEKSDASFLEDFDEALYDEVVNIYKETIESCCERCEFFIKILSDYKMFSTGVNLSEKCKEFAFTQWKKYEEEFEFETVDGEVKKALIQIILYNIVKRRHTINRIKKEVNL